MRKLWRKLTQWPFWVKFSRYGKSLDLDQTDYRSILAPTDKKLIDVAEVLQGIECRQSNVVTIQRQIITDQRLLQNNGIAPQITEYHARKLAYWRKRMGAEYCLSITPKHRVNRVKK